MFGDAYNKATNKLSPVVTTYTNGVNVQASTDDNLVVAPGTTGFMTFSVSGTAEVLSAITVKVATDYKDVTLTKGTGASALVYNPIVWTLSKTVTSAEGGEATTQLATGTLAQIANAINDETTGVCNNASIKPNESVANTTYTLSWEWKFTGSTVPTNFGISADEADTILGLSADEANTDAIDAYKAIFDAKYGEDAFDSYTAATTVSFNLTITVKQIQEEA